MSENLPDIPTPADFLLNYPLYAWVDFSSAGKNWILDLEYFRGDIDTYCAECNRHSIFRMRANYRTKTTKPSVDEVFTVALPCARNEDHLINFWICVEKTRCRKVGQDPSLADLHLPDLHKYRPILKDHFGEFTRGVGLGANGIGIGSCAYLRRILERLVEEAKTQAISDGTLGEDEYARSRMDERIQLLKPYLPEFMVKNRALYGILSKGIHELSEEECKSYFPILKLGIERILDAKLYELERKKKDQELGDSIARIKNKFK